MARIQDLDPISGFGATNIIIVDDGTETQTGTLTQLATFLQDNLNIPVSITDITGLQAALDDKSNVGHTHVIADIDGLQTILDAKLDEDQLSLNGNTLQVKGNFVNITTEESPDVMGGSLPTVSNINDFLQFSNTTGDVKAVSRDDFRAAIGIDLVANLNPIDYPISTIQQAALDLKRDKTDDIDYDTEVTNKPTIPAQADVDANSLKRSFTSEAELKLDGIEEGADVTDTGNVRAALGITDDGSTELALTQRGVYTDIGSLAVTKARVDSAIGATTGDDSLFYTQAGTWALVTSSGSITKSAIDNIIGANTAVTNKFYAENGTFVQPNLEDLGNVSNTDASAVNVENDKLFIYDSSANGWYRVNIQTILDLAGATGIRLAPSLPIGNQTGIYNHNDNVGIVDQGIYVLRDTATISNIVLEDWRPLDKTSFTTADITGLDAQLQTINSGITALGTRIDELSLENLDNVVSTDLDGSHDLGADRMLIYDATDSTWKRIGLVDLANAIGGGGSGLPNISAFTVNDNSADLAGQTITGTITGSEGTEYTISISSATDNFITDSALSVTTGTITGTSDTFTVTVPALDAVEMRSFDLIVTNDALSSNSITQSITQENNGNITSISLPNGISGGSTGGSATVTILGTANSIVNLSAINAGLDSSRISFDNTSVTLNGSGSGTAVISISNTIYEDVSFTFNVQGSVTGGNTVNSNQSTYTYSQPLLSSLTVSDLTFGQDGESTTVTVVGGVGTQFNFAISNPIPSGWITTGALGAVSGTIPDGGEFITTLQIPFAVGSVNRTFTLTATNSNKTSNVVSSGLIRQQVTEQISATFSPFVYPGNNRVIVIPNSGEFGYAEIAYNFLIYNTELDNNRDYVDTIRIYDIDSDTLLYSSHNELQVSLPDPAEMPNHVVPADTGVVPSFNDVTGVTNGDVFTYRIEIDSGNTTIFDDVVEVYAFTSGHPANTQWYVDNGFLIPILSADLSSVSLEGNIRHQPGSVGAGYANIQIHYVDGWVQEVATTAPFVSGGGPSVPTGGIFDSSDRISLRASYTLTGHSTGTRYYGVTTNVDISDNVGGIVNLIDLVASATNVIIGTDVTFSATVTEGNSPFTYVLADDNGTTVQTIGPTPSTSATFTSIDVSAFDPGDYTYTVTISDNDADQVVEMETFTIVAPGSGLSLNIDGRILWQDQNSGDTIRNMAFYVPDDMDPSDFRIDWSLSDGGPVADSSVVNSFPTTNRPRNRTTNIANWSGSTNGDSDDTRYFTLLDISTSPNTIIESGSFTAVTFLDISGLSNCYLSPMRVDTSSGSLRAICNTARISYSNSVRGAVQYTNTSGDYSNSSNIAIQSFTGISTGFVLSDSVIFDHTFARGVLIDSSGNVIASGPETPLDASLT